MVRPRWSWQSTKRRFPHARGDGPDGLRDRRLLLSFPHARGDGPARRVQVFRPDVFSPRTWGWSGHDLPSLYRTPVFPTHVGMVRNLAVLMQAHERFPHARGDGPRPNNTAAPPPPFSPRTWGWSAKKVTGWHTPRVFPTHVGMVRRF